LDIIVIFIGLGNQSLKTLFFKKKSISPKTDFIIFDFLNKKRRKARKRQFGLEINFTKKER
jgi:hypothetical protein